jgi:hypothetical protein
MRLSWVYLSEKVQALRRVLTVIDGMFVQRQIHKHDIYESCVSCRELTQNEIGSDIKNRLCYIEGTGQLCRDCWETLYNYNPESRT